MSNYIDGFVFPITERHLNQYQAIAQEVATIWKEHGATGYQEWASDGFTMEGIRSFGEELKIADDEVIVFGWMSFASKEDRDRAHKLVSTDQRMIYLVQPLVDPSDIIFACRPRAPWLLACSRTSARSILVRRDVQRAHRVARSDLIG